MRFNVNDHVRVRLTDAGRAELIRQHANLVTFAPSLSGTRPFEEDADGWSRHQLWKLMRDLGALCGAGRELPFETEIEIEEEIGGADTRPTRLEPNSTQTRKDNDS